MVHLARTRVHRSLVATMLGLALLTLVSACGMEAQTMQPYTPAEGVNFNVGPTGKSVQVRNLMILSREDGVGYLSASIVAQERDALTAVAGRPFKPDDTEGAPFDGHDARSGGTGAGRAGGADRSRADRGQER